jgi:hypothetical protein
MVDVAALSLGAIAVVPPYGLTSADAFATADGFRYDSKRYGPTAECTLTSRHDRDQPFYHGRTFTLMMVDCRP